MSEKEREGERMRRRGERERWRKTGKVEESFE
jgi:hypothetical protein